MGTGYCFLIESVFHWIPITVACGLFVFNCRWVDSVEGNDMVSNNRTVVPSIPIGVSGTALAASLRRDGWSVSYLF